MDKEALLNSMVKRIGIDDPGDIDLLLNCVSNFDKNVVTSFMTKLKKGTGTKSVIKIFSFMKENKLNNCKIEDCISYKNELSSDEMFLALCKKVSLNIIKSEFPLYCPSSRTNIPNNLFNQRYNLSYVYGYQDIKTVSDYLANLLHKDVFEVYCTDKLFNAVRSHLIKFKEDGISRFLLIELKKNYWVLMCCIVENNKFHFLYKDSLGEPIVTSFETDIESLFPANTYFLHYNLVQQHSNPHRSAQFALLNLKTILENVNIEVTHGETQSKFSKFIKEFSNFKFSSRYVLNQYVVHDFPRYFVLRSLENLSQLPTTGAIISLKNLFVLLGHLNILPVRNNRDIILKFLNCHLDDKVLKSQDCPQFFLDTLRNKISRLLLKGSWHENSLSKLFHQSIKLEENPLFRHCISSFNLLEELITFLDVLYDYNIHDSNDIIRKILMERTSLITHMEEIVDSFYNHSVEKSIDQLISEIYELNVSIPELTKDELKLFYERVKNHLMDYPTKNHPEKQHQNIEETSSDYLLKKCSRPRGPIGLWTKSSIKLWTISISKETDVEEMIAVLIHGISLTKDIRVRDVQILSLIIMISSSNRGRLVQINTGEGKTLLITMFAAYKALRGSTVDVITTSSELAVPQSKEFRDFYELFGLSVGHNYLANQVQLKESYRAHVLYGEISCFQGDLLKDEFLKYDIRKRRKLDVAIADEVDNMLLDGQDSIVRLSSSLPGLNDLLRILGLIWTRLDSEIDTLKEEKVSRDYVKKKIENYIKSVVGISSERNKPQTFPVEFPRHLHKYVMSLIPVWIDNAIYAKFFCEENKNYIIEDGDIKPVDLTNTGCILFNTKWSNGLHQYLQLKHGLKVSNLCVTTNFISLSGYFKRYNYVYGFSGTLGNLKAKEVVRDIHELDCVIIPPFKVAVHCRLENILVNDINYWFHTIVQTCMYKLNSGRAVLIIADSIKTCHSIENIFKSSYGYDPSKVHIYSTNRDSKVLDKVMDCGDLLIATNIAGRGTDIRLSNNVEKNGGLHVLITFLPESDRVELQNIGRTSRSGFKGTSQIIMRKRKSYVNDEKLKRKREDQEKQWLNKSKSTIMKMLFKDEIFQSFCDLLESNDVMEREDVFLNNSAIEERFGLWLKVTEVSIENDEKIRDELSNFKQSLHCEFDKFKNEIIQDRANKRLINNSYRFILKGNHLFQKNIYSEAMDQYTEAIALDYKFSEMAFLNRGLCKIQKLCQKVNIKTEKCTDDIISDLNESYKLFSMKKENLCTIFISAQSKKAISYKVHFLDSVLKFIDNLKNDCKKLINNSECQFVLVTSNIVQRDWFQVELREFQVNGFLNFYEINIKENRLRLMYNKLMKKFRFKNKQVPYESVNIEKQTQSFTPLPLAESMLLTTYESDIDSIIANLLNYLFEIPEAISEIYHEPGQMESEEFDYIRVLKNGQLAMFGFVENSIETLKTLVQSIVCFISNEQPSEIFNRIKFSSENCELDKCNNETYEFSKEELENIINNVSFSENLEQTERKVEISEKEFNDIEINTDDQKEINEFTYDVVTSMLYRILLAIVNSVIGFAKAVIKLLTAVMEHIIIALKTIMKPVVDAVKAVVKSIINTVKTITKPIINTVKTIVKPIISGIETVCATVVNASATVWNAFKTGCAKAKTYCANVITSISNWWSNKSVTTNNENSLPERVVEVDKKVPLEYRSEEEHIDLKYGTIEFVESEDEDSDMDIDVKKYRLMAKESDEEDLSQFVMDKYHDHFQILFLMLLPFLFMFALKICGLV